MELSVDPRVSMASLELVREITRMLATMEAHSTPVVLVAVADIALVLATVDTKAVMVTAAEVAMEADVVAMEADAPLAHVVTADVAMAARATTGAPEDMVVHLMAMAQAEDMAAMEAQEVLVVMVKAMAQAADGEDPDSYEIMFTKEFIHILIVSIFLPFLEFH